MDWQEWIHLKEFTAVLGVLIFLREIKEGTFKGLREKLQFSPAGGPLMALGLWILLILPIFFLDTKILGAVQDIESPFLLSLIKFGGVIGKSINPWMVMALGYAFGFLTKRRVVVQTVLGCISSSLLASSVGHFLKFVFLRARPFGDFGPFSFFNIAGLSENEQVYQSLPSGDVAVVAGSAFYLFFASRRPFLSWPILILPLLTAASRVALDRHWPSDTFLALGLGYFFARLLHAFDRRKPLG